MRVKTREELPWLYYPEFNSVRIVNAHNFQDIDLTIGLENYWKLDEASGSRVDSHATKTLTDNNTVGSEAGKIGNAASFIAANSEYLSASPIDFQRSFTLSLWVKLSAKNSFNALFTQASSNLPQDSAVQIDYHAASDRFRFVLFNVSTAKVLAASALGSPSIGNWYHLFCRYDATASQMSIRGNNGTINTLGSVSLTNLTTGANTLQFGAQTTQGGRYHSGAIDEVGFWSRALTNSEGSSLYSSGNGRSYENF